MSKLEDLAYKIKELLEKHDAFYDTRIYFEGKALSSSEGLIEGIIGSDFFEYSNDDTISMSFEGILYDILNFHMGEHPLILELDQLFNSYGYYYELGNAWNLSLYES